MGLFSIKSDTGVQKSTTKWIPLCSFEDAYVTFKFLKLFSEKKKKEKPSPVFHQPIAFLFLFLILVNKCSLVF